MSVSTATEAATTTRRRVNVDENFLYQDEKDFMHIASRAQLKEEAGSQWLGSRVCWVTPQLAGWLLELNTGNRKVSARRVERYKHIILHGEWLNTGEPIIVADDMTLNEGQHRLLAIRDTGIAVPCDIRFGITRKAFAATGTGATRSLGDVISISGEAQYASNIAAAANLLHRYRLGLPSSSTAIVTHQEILKDVRRMKDDLMYAARLAFRLKGLHSMRITNAPTMAFIVLAYRHQNNQKRLEEFMEIVASGLASAASNPARRLYDRLRREEAEASTGPSSRAGAVEKLALYIKAWKAWLAKEEMPPGALRWRGKGQAAEDFPELPGVRL
jgi:hypothetical protein